MMEAEDPVYPDDVRDGKVWEHDVQAHVAKLLVVACQVGVQARVKVAQGLDWLQHNLQ